VAKKSTGPQLWTVGDLGSFYAEHRSELHAHASRVLKDSVKAQEITQDALIKFMLAAPELESAEHALAYLHRTIENLCIDFFRAEGRRPNLVVLDDATAEIEAQWQDNGDHSAAMSQAEDAAILRQALALLSPAERAALVMWEIEGRSTNEIAAELGIKESAVRHTVSRARASLRTVLATLVINEETGLTALDALSTTYKKAAELAQKSSKAALSLLLIVTAFFGFNSMKGSPASIVATTNTPSTTTQSADPSASATPSRSAAEATAAAAAKRKSQMNAINVKAAPLSFYGLDKTGVPTAFSVTDESNVAGIARVTKGVTSLGTIGIIINNQFITGSVGPNVLIDQVITIDGTGTHYSANSLSVGFGGNWNAVEINSIDSSIERLGNGTNLITATFNVGYLKPSEFAFPVGNRGADLSDAPKTITTRILMNAGKTQVLAQAVQVINK
jgi:RNA polymerase sigma factor (sigma-70 family)